MRIALLLAALAATSPSAALAQDAPSEGEDVAAESDGEAPASPPGEAEAGAEAPPDQAGQDAASQTPESEPPTPPPRRRARTDPDASPPPTTASSALGVVTILAAVGAVAGITTWIEREDNVARCAAYEIEEPRHRACLNVAAIRDQRDVGIGLTVGFGVLTAGAAITWAVVAATSPSSAEPRAFACAPGLLSIECAGRF